ncbi:MAG: hypothetical protein ACRC7H_08890 [Plesiomonas shigelloides]
MAVTRVGDCPCGGPYRRAAANREQVPQNDNTDRCLAWRMAMY